MTGRADTTTVDALVVLVEQASGLLHTYTGTGRPIDKNAVLELLGAALRPLVDPDDQPDVFPPVLQGACELVVFGIEVTDR